MPDPRRPFNLLELEDRLNQIEGELWWVRRLMWGALLLAGAALALGLWRH